MWYVYTNNYFSAYTIIMGSYNVSWLLMGSLIVMGRD